jgi:putative ABC transport system permease protein
MQRIGRLIRYFSLRHLFQDPWRTVIVILGVGVGASVFLSVRLAVDASVDSFAKSMGHLMGKAEYTVRSDGSNVSEGLFAALSAHPAVQHAAPVLSAYVRFNDETNEPFRLIGIDPLAERVFRETQWLVKDRSEAWELLKALVTEPFTFVASQNLADSYDLEKGERVLVVHGHNKVPFRLAGLLGDEGPALAEGGNIAVCDISTAQEFFGRLGVLERIDLILKPGADEAVLSALRGLLPGGCRLVRPHVHKEASLSLIKAYRMNLSVLSFVSLFVGMFLVFSVVSINAARRRHETAVLLSLGSESRQVFLLFLGEGLFFGLAGWLVGFPLGLFLADQFLKIVSATITTLFVRVDVEAITLSPEEIVASFVMTLGVSVIAAFVPARETARIPPQEALSPETFERTRRLKAPRLALVGAALVCLSLPVSALPPVRGIPAGGYTAIFMIFVGFSMMAPGVLILFARYLPGVMFKAFGPPGRLAAGYLAGTVSRTAIAVGALITAIALFIGVSIMVSSFRNTVDTWLEQNVVGDLFVRPDASDINQYRDWLAPELVDHILGSDRVEDPYLYRRIILTGKEGPFLLEAGRVEVLWRRGRFLLLKGQDEERMMEGLVQGKGVIISEVYATRTGLGPGDRLALSFDGLRREWEVLGVFRDYRTGGGVVFIALSVFEEVYGKGPVGGVNLFVKEGVSPQATKEDLLDRFGNRYALSVAVGDELRREIIMVFDDTFSITYVLMAIALLVAALGVATTLSLLVRERRRQLGLMFSVGATLGQVRTMIVLEALLMGIAGYVVGMGCGLVLSYFLIFVVNKQSFGWTFLFQIPPWTIGASFVLILLAAVSASVPPARGAARVNLAELLKAG